MTKLQLSLIGTVLLVSLAGTLFIRSRTQTKFGQNETALRQLDDRVAALRPNSPSVVDQAGRAGSAQSNDAPTELSKLRDEAGALRKQASELEERRKKDQSTKAPVDPERYEPHPPEYYEQLHRLGGAKGRDAVTLGYMLRLYASEHQGQFPSSLEVLKPYLDKEQAPLSGTNQFEIVYKGSMDALLKVPSSAVALFRDRETFIAPSGKPARVYGMADGSGQTVESDDNFQAWEAAHIIPAETAKP